MEHNTLENISFDKIDPSDLAELEKDLITISVTDESYPPESKTASPKKMETVRSKPQSKLVQLQYKDLFIDETEYFNLRAKTQPSFVELVRIEIFEKMKDLKRELNAERIKKADIEEELRKFQLEQENLKAKIENNRFIFEARNATSEEKIRRLTGENEDFKKRCEKAEEQWNENKAKIQRYDEVSDSYLALKREHDRLLDSVSIQAKTLEQFKEERSQFESQKQKLESQCQLLNSDKNYLSRDNLNLSEKLRLAEETSKELREELKETKRQSQSNFEKLMNKTSEVESEYQARLKADLTEMKQKYREDTETMKKLQEELAERKCQFLQEQVTELKSRLRKEETDHLERKKTLEFTQDSMRELEKTTNEEIAMLRVKLRVKTDDCDRLEASSEEANKLLAVLKTESTADKDKLTFLRNEMIRKEASLGEELANIRARLTVAQEKLRSYDEVENEMDKVIYDSALERSVLK